MIRRTLCILLCALPTLAAATSLPYTIVDTAQTTAFDTRKSIPLPSPGEPYYGQDANYTINAPSYTDNHNGTISDQHTGLMWTQDPGAKKTYAQAVKGATGCRVGDYNDWRLPTIKELYSLIQFNGTDPDPRSTQTSKLSPFISEVFAFQYGTPAQNERVIDSQFATSTQYVSTTMNGNDTMFGVNFADGRIKGYPIESRRGKGKFYVLYVRGNPDYGINQFKDNGDGTITDHATGLTWMQADSGTGMDWPTALEYSENLNYAGHSDWRLPNAKELQSILDYTRSPDTSNSAAIDPIFQTTEIKNEGDETDYGFYWSSTSHKRGPGASAAVDLCFGRALGFMKSRRTGEYQLLDVHGAGAQRSDPKVGDASRYPHGRGPQGDVIRIENLVRCVRGGTAN